MKKILLDVTPLKLPFCGIQSDASAITRLLLNSSLADSLDFMGGGVKKSPLFRRKSDPLLQEALWLAKLSEASQSNIVSNILLELKSALLCYRSKFPLQPIESPLLKETFFRFFFGKECWDSELRDRIQSRPGLITNISQDVIIKKTLLPGCPVAQLDTSGYDLFLTHQDHMPLRLSPSTKYVVRYHDSIPILHPDLMKNANYSVKYRYAALKKTVDMGAYFVCNSDQTRQDLLSMFPAIEPRVRVIAPVVDGFRPQQNLDRAIQLLRTKAVVSSKTLKIPQPDSDPVKEIEDGRAEYIMTIAPLEPKKNIIRLLKAFHKVRLKTKQKLKLVILGSKGWNNKDMLKLVLAGVKSGEVIWLQDLFRDEVQVVLSHAKVFAFVSLMEGFGIPPLEAMSCGVPVVSSDIPVHRATQGNASLYCNPYDHREIAEAIASLCGAENGAQRSALIEKGKAISSRYAASLLTCQWEELLDEWTR